MDRRGQAAQLEIHELLVRRDDAIDIGEMRRRGSGSNTVTINARTPLQLFGRFVELIELVDLVDLSL